jgi:tetratricopeptide (TPR) repeat protein
MLGGGDSRMPGKQLAQLIDFTELKSKRKGSISLCMIARDEEELIGRALASVRDLVDEMIVVDTGSVDNTVAEATRLGARVFSFPWKNDFSEARNFALSKATREWILVLDADEEIDAGDRDRIHRLAAEGAHEAFIMRQWTYTRQEPGFGWAPSPPDSRMSMGCGGYYESQQARLFRNERLIRYEGAIHETLDWSLMAAHIPVREADVVIHHYGRMEETGRVCRKSFVYCAAEMSGAESRASNPRCLYEMAAQLLDLGKVDEALAHGEKAITLEPKAWELWNVAALAHLRRGEKEKALEYFHRALEIGRDIPELCNNLGVVLMERRESAEALALFERGLAVDPSDAELLRNAAVACARCGDLERGRAYIERSLSADPFAAHSHAIHADILQRLDDLGGAVEALEKIRFLRGTPFKVYVKEIQIYVRMGMIEDADAAVERALEEFPERDELLYVAGKTAELGCEDERAAAWYNRFLALRPGHVDAHASLGCICERGERLEEALSHFGEALRLDPGNTRVEVNIGIVLDKLGRTEEAAGRFERAMANGERSGFAYNAVGCHHARMNRFDEALPYFAKAVELEPAEASYYRNLGLACEKVNEPERAEAAYERLARLDPLMASFANERLRKLHGLVPQETQKPLL